MIVLLIIFGIVTLIVSVVMIGGEDSNKNTVQTKAPAKIPGKTRVRIDNFEPKYRSVMDENLFVYLQKQRLNGEDYAYIDKSTIRELNDRMVKRKSQVNNYNKLAHTASNNNRGITLEKSGKIKDAIDVYENNIYGDCYPACHSFDRLMILYRKQKDYENEIRVIERAIEVLCPRYPDLLPKYEQRLQKATELLDKQAEK